MSDFVPRRRCVRVIALGVDMLLLSDLMEVRCGVQAWLRRATLSCTYDKALGVSCWLTGIDAALLLNGEAWRAQNLLRPTFPSDHKRFAASISFSLPASVMAGGWPGDNAASCFVSAADGWEGGKKSLNTSATKEHVEAKPKRWCWINKLWNYK